jgi:hypothetical protein
VVDNAFYGALYFAGLVDLVSFGASFLLFVSFVVIEVSHG